MNAASMLCSQCITLMCSELFTQRLPHAASMLHSRHMLIADAVGIVYIVSVMHNMIELKPKTTKFSDEH